MDNDSRHYQQQLDSNDLYHIPIRRHILGSTNPTTPQLSSRSLSPTSYSHLPTKRNSSQTNSFSVSSQNYSSMPFDPDERPIKPMKDTSIYNKPSSPKKNFQTKKPLSQEKPVRSSLEYESESFQLPPSRTPIHTVTPRRPIRADIIPKNPIHIPTQRIQSRPLIVEEYEYVDDHDYPTIYTESVPKKVVSYQQVSGLTTRELENYQMSRVRPVTHVRSPIIKTIIYRP